MAYGKGGNRPGEDGPYRPPNPSDAPPYPPKKISKKPKKRKGQYSRPSAEDRLYGETDIIYGEVARGKDKFKRDPRTGPNIA